MPSDSSLKVTLCLCVCVCECVCVCVCVCFIDAPLGESRFPFKLARGLPKNLNLTDSFLINVTRFLYKQLHFRLEPQVAYDPRRFVPKSHLRDAYF